MANAAQKIREAQLALNASFAEMKRVSREGGFVEDMKGLVRLELGSGLGQG